MKDAHKKNVEMLCAWAFIWTHCEVPFAICRWGRSWWNNFCLEFNQCSTIMERDWLCTNIQHTPRCRLGEKKSFWSSSTATRAREWRCSQSPTTPDAAWVVYWIEFNSSIIRPFIFLYAFIFVLIQLTYVTWRLWLGEELEAKLRYVHSWVVVTLV